MKTKELLAGGLVRDLWFINEDTLQIYLAGLYYEYKILDKYTRPDGSVIVRLLTPYNSAPLIELYEEA